MGEPYGLLGLQAEERRRLLGPKLDAEALDAALATARADRALTAAVELLVQTRAALAALSAKIDRAEARLRAKAVTEQQMLMRQMGATPRG
jgi:hypothetical protein